MHGNNVTVLPSQDLVLVRLVGDAAGDARNEATRLNEYGGLALQACEGGTP